MRLGWAGKAALTAALPVVAGMAAFLWVTLDRVEHVTRKQIERSLLGEAQVGARVLDRVDWGPAELREWARQLGGDIDTRVTVIEADGTVIADNEVADVATMENHGERPEIKAAREKPGSSIR